MVTHYSDDRVTVHHGDCLDVLRGLPDTSVDAVVTDPPYGLSDVRPEAVAAALTAWASGDRESVPGARGFMGKQWDAFVPPPAVWDECLRVLKPGGHLIAFSGARTYDLMGLSIRMAGFEIRDGLVWLYGSGMPKGLDVAKAIDKAAGIWRGRAGAVTSSNDSLGGPNYARTDKGSPATATATATAWDGWNTSLKPSLEPMVLARKPLAESGVAANVVAHGTGALNIDATRVAMNDDDREKFRRGREAWARRDERHDEGRKVASVYGTYGPTKEAEAHSAGRWPTNTLMDEHAAAELDQQSGTRRSSGVYGGDGSRKPGEQATDFGGGHRPATMYGDSGGASRFFPVFRYQAKAPARERPKVDGVSHPTVKPLDLMRWLARLVCPPGGVVLDPFAGSGTTIEAALQEGFHVIGVEREPDYLPLIMQRIQRATTPEQTADGPDGLFDLPAA